MNNIKVAVIGANGVGKTCLLVQLTRNTFNEDYTPTIQDMFEKKITYQGQEYTLKITDTGGKDENANLTDSAIKESDAFVLVYSIISENSFTKVQDNYQKIKQLNPKNSNRIVIVGTKSDLESERMVPEKKAFDYSVQISAGFFESSAKTNTNVTDIFSTVVQKYVLYPNQDSSKDGEGGCCILI